MMNVGLASRPIYSIKGNIIVSNVHTNYDLVLCYIKQHINIVCSDLVE